MKDSGCCEEVMKLWALSYQALGEEIIQCGAWPPLFMCSWRFSSVIHEMYGCKRADSVSGCVLGAHRGGEGRVKVHWREVSFICIWHTSLLCYSDSTIILITVCLPLHPPTPSYFSFYWQERSVYRQICSTFGTSPSNWTVKKVLFEQVLRYILNKLCILDWLERNYRIIKFSKEFQLIKNNILFQTVCTFILTKSEK